MTQKCLRTSISVLARMSAVAAVVLLAVACGSATRHETETPLRSNALMADSAKTVVVRLAGPDGKPKAPESVSKVVKTDAEWKRLLTPEQYRVARGRGTEPAFCGGLLANKEQGVYSCVCCSLPLFSSKSKFESGPVGQASLRPLQRRISLSAWTEPSAWSGPRYSACAAMRTSGTYSRTARRRPGSVTASTPSPCTSRRSPLSSSSATCPARAFDKLSVLSTIP